MEIDILSIAREITKIYKQFIRGKVERCLSIGLKKTRLKGECCIVVEGIRYGRGKKILYGGSLSITEHVKHYEVTMTCHIKRQ